MEPLAPVDVIDLFPDERANLLRLLVTLSDEEWTTLTACPGWTVKDLALHVLGVDVGVLSRGRDRFRDPATVVSGDGAQQWAGLVDLVNRLNATWVEATRRLSPRLLCDLLTFSGGALAAYYQTLDPMAVGGPVSWAGPDPAPLWLDLAREYTERWVHQQQIRDALGRPGLTTPRYLAPVLATCVHALPQTLRGVLAPPGTLVRLVVDGPAGGAWSALRTEGAWTLGRDETIPAAATVIIDEDSAWRVFTRGMTPDEALRHARLEGDRALAARMLRMVSIIA